jgi:hypothetical protein
MKYFVSMAVLSLMFCGAQAAQNARPTMVGKMVGNAPRYTASVNQLNSGGTADTTTTTPEPVIDRREAERNACINNNIGVGNTFVWASRFSNTSNYASMTEDMDNPQNNVCFVRVEIKSDDAKISVSDVPAKYFMWGENIECGSWANEKEMEKRILDAKKGARIGGVVASTVAGAGIGVGAMELFGNKAIGGKVMGQKSMEGVQLYRSQLLVYKEKNPAEYNKIVSALKVLQANGETKIGDENIESLLNEFAK